eukprot:CAMPEP_0198202572 /NCGR_PEP_ID=MMETSP1445-20131203/5754_1 /TAXON_ID=36898 /ORGANISM="Pyramimonas sp., Strain CCMP2087" /LENGTH=563 /DNA_ID=CAMNT_0043873561 /DNA_START=292 /DNA_END=1983 /DNA_ORIENTATION=+
MTEVPMVPMVGALMVPMVGALMDEDNRDTSKVETSSDGHNDKTSKTEVQNRKLTRDWFATTHCWLLSSAAFLVMLALFLGLYVGTSVFGSYYDAASSSTAPNVPVVIPAALSVRSEILFATLDISAFESSPAFELAFRTNFSEAIAAQAGVSPSQVNIVSITAGSVKVLSVVYFAATERPLADAFEAKVRGNASDLFLTDAANAVLWQPYGAIEATLVEGTPDSCPIRRVTHLGDGWCDSGAANTPECGWDSGDCCNVDAPLFNCRDPLSSNFGRAAPTGAKYPVPRNPRYAVTERPQSTEGFVSSYNNYYEFGFSKSAPAATTKRADIVDFFEGPWTVKIEGLVESPMEIDVKDLIDMFHIEERLYRHRCVEAWSIVVPWNGFPLYKLLDLVKPLAAAKYISFQTFHDPLISSFHQEGQGRGFDWPYLEGLSMEEARNEMAFLSVGQYQAPLPPQSGAPLRLTLPWKYGFKSAKSLVSIKFVEEQPQSFWTKANRNEYGFWANVNPQVKHPRWSQASEKQFTDKSFGSSVEQIDTQLYNGYGNEVAYLYEDLKDDLGDVLYI